MDQGQLQYLNSELYLTICTESTVSISLSFLSSWQKWSETQTPAAWRQTVMSPRALSRQAEVFHVKPAGLHRNQEMQSTILTKMTKSTSPKNRSVHVS